MAFKVIVKPITFLDVDEAIIYYEKRSSGLGKRFYFAFLSCIEKIEAYPIHYRFAKDPVRRCRIEKFPFKVFYLISGETIFILGVAHDKRSNTFIKRRLRPE